MATVTNITDDLAQIITVTIANGASLSDAADMKGHSLVALEMPAAWTAADITFEASPDGVTYNDVHIEAGTERTLTVAVDRFVLMDQTLWKGVRFLKVRSGTSSVPVNQLAERSIRLYVKQI